MPTRRCMDEHVWSIHTMGGGGHRKERSNDTRYNMGEPRKYYTESERSQTPMATACDSVYVKRPEQADPRDGKQMGVCQGQWEGHGVTVCGDRASSGGMKSGTRRRWWLHDPASAPKATRLHSVFCEFYSAEVPTAGPSATGQGAPLGGVSGAFPPPACACSPVWRCSAPACPW